MLRAKARVRQTSIPDSGPTPRGENLSADLAGVANAGQPSGLPIPYPHVQSKRGLAA